MQLGKFDILHLEPMRPLLFTLALLAGLTSIAQTVTISDNSYVYVSDRGVYTRGNIYFNGNDARIYLRGNSVLAQGDLNNDVVSTPHNYGTGYLSIFQEGTENNFNYNYWSSPVGVDPTPNDGSATGVFDPSQNIWYDLTTTSGGLQNVDSAIANVGAQAGFNGVTDDGSAGTPLRIAQRWIWQYNQVASSAYADWQYVGAGPNNGGASVGAGYGFTMKGVSGTGPNIISAGDAGGTGNFYGEGQRYDFRGIPHTGNIDVQVLAGGTAADPAITLVGNPYPSSMNLQEFLLDLPASVEMQAEFWDSDPNVNTHILDDYRGGYGTYVPMGGSGTGVYTQPTFFDYDSAGNQTGAVATPTQNIPRQYIAVGQGFVLSNSTANATVTFRDKYRDFTREDRNAPSGPNDGGPYFKSQQAVTGKNANPMLTGWEDFRLQMSFSNNGVREVVAQFHPMATTGWDRGAEAVGGGEVPMDAYFISDSRNAIITANNFDVAQALPIEVIMNQAGTIKFEISDISTFSYPEVYIYDALNNTYNDITGTNSYTATVPAGTESTRFSVVFQDGVTLANDELNASNLDIFQDNSAQTLSILNPEQQAMESVDVYDTAGKLVISQNAGTDTELTINTGNWSEGIYVVRVSLTDGATTTKRVGVKN